MPISDEFTTVDLLLESKAESRGVDAFALSFIKVERQLRRLLTYLVFQSDALSERDVKNLQNALADRRRVYLNHLMVAWDELCEILLADLVGQPISTTSVKDCAGHPASQ
jgi:hypothetical protein